ncbi:hypothetical protein [Fortiea contorta]|uniref:hypothetical protein n=1 Tax=Fortiea contorta TaxID=1892405 RepID=UPI0003818F51|nr:hypothetical protein [Fortiea contorta]
MTGNDWIEVKVPSTPKSTTANTWVELHLPNAQTLGRYCIWGIGRVVFSCSLFSVVVTRNILKLGVVFCDHVERGVKHLLKVYDALPYGGTPVSQVIEASAVAVSEPLEIITDILAAIEGKHRS